MKTITNKTIIMFITLLAFTSAMSQNVDSSFTYQGELIDNGAPANGQYDINLDLIDGDMFPFGNTSEHSPVEVVNGLFSVNADFGISKYDGYKDVTVTVSIRKTSEGPGGAFTVLGSQTIQAVPLATNLTNGNATAGQVLTFNGFQWSPIDPVATGSPWTVNGSTISYTSGPVNIGSEISTFSSEALNVGTSNGLSATFNGGDRMYVYFAENGLGRGYVGSYQTPSGNILDEDFEIGTTFSSIGNLHLVTGNNNPRVTIDADGLVGVGTTNPLAKLQVESDGASEDPLRVRVSGQTKLWVKGDGSTNFFDDTKQSISSNGMMKFMVDADCNATPTITKSYNGIANSTGSISIALGSGAGSCEITFPEDIDDRYWQVSPVYASSNSNPGLRGATCRIDAPNDDTLRCERFNNDTGSLSSGSIMIMVY